MHPFPHHYHASASGLATGSVDVSDGRLRIATQAPPEFGGPEGFWSPETLLVASIADCYILSFRAVARASKLEWQQLDVAVEGVLDRLDGVTRFVKFIVRPRLVLPDPERESLAATVLEKSKRSCLVTNSLSAECELAPEITACAT